MMRACYWGMLYEEATRQVYAQYRSMENRQDGLNLFWFRLLSRRFELWRRVCLCCWAIKLP